MKKGVQFRNNILNDAFAKDGFVVLRGCCKTEVEVLLNFIASLKINFTANFYYSLLNFDFSDNLIIANKIKGVLKLTYERIFTNYTSRNESFLSKPLNDNNELYLHQDWCYTDADKYQTATFWLPLTDTHKLKGGLFVVPGSHTFFDNYISGNIFTARIHSKDLPADSIVYIDTEPGDIVVFNPSVFHGSCPNLSGESRPVITSNIFPADAPFSYYHKISDNEIIRANLADDFYYKDLPGLVAGSVTLSAEETIRYTHKDLDAADLTRHITAV